MFLKRILRKLRCQHYFVLNRWSWIHPTYGTPYIVAEYICRKCNKSELITLKNADAAAWADTMGTWREEKMPNAKDKSSCYGCRCETCRWRAAGSNCYYNEYVAFRQEFSWEV